MIYLERVALEIKEIGLYDLILQDVVKLSGKKRPTKEEILEVLQKHPEVLRDYKQLNVEYNLSNIHLKEIPLEKIDASCRQKAQLFNKNLQMLREIEKYTLDFEQSSTLVIIFSIEFFVLFSVQYFIVLLDLKEWQWWIYSLFAASALVAWWYAKKERKKYELNNNRFEKLYDETLLLLDELEKKRCIDRKDLLIAKAEEHV